MQLEKSPNLYTVNEGEFKPVFSANLLNHGNVLISMLYRTDETTHLDASSDNHVHLVGPAFTVVRIILYHQYGQKPVIFNSQEYLQNLDGYYRHNWMLGIGLSLPGILFGGLRYSIVVVRSKKKRQLELENPSETIVYVLNAQTEKVIQS